MSVIVIAPDAIVDYFVQRLDTDVYGVGSFQSFEEGLSSGKLPPVPDSIIIHQNSTKGADEIAFYVSRLCSDVCIGIITPEETFTRIKDKVQTMIQEEGLTYAPFFYLSNQPIPDFNRALAEWREWGREAYPEDASVGGEAAVQEAWRNAGSFDETPTHDNEPSVHGKVFCVTSSKGGSGKSTSAIMIASAISRSSQMAFERGQTGRPARVCLVDMDVFDGQIGFIIGESQPTVTNLMSTSSNDIMFTNDNVQKFAVRSDSLGVDFYLAPRLPTSAKSVQPEFYDKLINTLKRVYDFVFIDTSVSYLTDERIYAVAYPRADAILNITTLSVHTVLGLSRWVDIVTKDRAQGGQGVPASKIGVVINHSHAKSGIDKSELVKVIKNPDVTILGDVPDLPASLIDRYLNSRRMDLLLAEGEFGYGRAIFNVASTIAGDLPMIPLFDTNAQGDTQQTPQQAPQQAQPVAPEPTKKKRKKFLGIF